MILDVRYLKGLTVSTTQVLSYMKNNDSVVTDMMQFDRGLLPNRSGDNGNDMRILWDWVSIVWSP